MNSRPERLPSEVYDFERIRVEPTPMGQRRAFITSPTATLDEFAVHMTTLNPGQAPHPRHPDVQCAQGRRVFLRAEPIGLEVDRKSRRVKPDREEGALTDVTGFRPLYA